MAALTYRVLSFALCMQMLTFHFQKYLTEAKVPEHRATIS